MPENCVRRRTIVETVVSNEVFELCNRCIAHIVGSSMCARKRSELHISFIAFKQWAENVENSRVKPKTNKSRYSVRVCITIVRAGVFSNIEKTYCSIFT